MSTRLYYDLVKIQIFLRQLYSIKELSFYKNLFFYSKVQSQKSVYISIRVENSKLYFSLIFIFIFIFQTQTQNQCNIIYIIKHNGGTCHRMVTHVTVTYHRESSKTNNILQYTYSILVLQRAYRLQNRLVIVYIQTMICGVYIDQFIIRTSSSFLV